MRITVIVANRNNARFLSRCVQSVQAQTVAAKIIVVDDASTDESRSLLRSYADSKIISLIENERQLGVGRSRALAASACETEFLTTLDADDYYYSAQKLAAEAAALRSHPRGTIAFSDVMRVDEQGRDIGLVSSSRRIKEGDLSFEIPHLIGFIPRDYLVSREDYMRAGGYDEELPLYEDWDLKIKLAQFCSWRFSGVTGTAYRTNPTGLSKAPLRLHIETMRRIFWANCRAQSAVARGLAFSRFFLYQSLYLRRPAAL